MDVGTDVSACRAVPQVSYLTQVLRQVILMVSLSSQLKVATEWVQPHWIGPAEALNPSVRGYTKDLAFEGIKISFKKMVNSNELPDLWRKERNDWIMCLFSHNLLCYRNAEDT